MLLLSAFIVVSAKNRSDDGLRPIGDRQPLSLIRRATAMQHELILLRSYKCRFQTVFWERSEAV